MGGAEERHRQDRCAVAFTELLVELLDGFDAVDGGKCSDRSIRGRLVVDGIAGQGLPIETVDDLGDHRLRLTQDVHRGL